MPANALGPPPLGPRTWLSWSGIALLVVFGRLPWSLQRVFGRGLGVLLRIALPTRRDVAARNLALCFPELDEPARDALLHAHFNALGVGVFEFSRAWWGSMAPLRRDLEI